MSYHDIKNKLLYWIPKILAILLGVFFIVFGEFDGSPGLQGIGLILIIATIAIVIRGKKKK
jgi:drug/metabolite transporter (DMT)-like permease